MAMANLAATWWQQGRSDEAEKLEVEVLELQKSVFGGRHPDTIRPVASIHQTQPPNSQAEQIEVKLSHCSSLTNTRGGLDQLKNSSVLPRERFKRLKDKI